MIRIVVADDHQMFIDGIESILGGEPGTEVIGKAKMVSS